MRRVVADIEADGFEPTQVWVIVTQEVGSEEQRVWLKPDFPAFLTYAATVDEWVFHNGLNYDVPHLNRLMGQCIDPSRVWDTFVISRLTQYRNFKGHGLDELGTALGHPKTDYTGGFDALSQEMIDYCCDDVAVLMDVYLKQERFIDDPTWHDAIQCEQRMARICFDMHTDGFLFDKALASTVLLDVLRRMDRLEAEFQRIWPPVRTEVSRILFRIRKDGVLYPNVREAIENKDTERQGSSLLIFEPIGFNPGSSKHRVEKLWESGWNPIEKTDNHYKFSMQAKPGAMWGKTKLTKEKYEEKKAYFAYYGWTVNDDNLETLPDDAPEGAGALSEWLTLNGRKTALEERLRECEEDSRIRTRFWHIGAWTHRMSHSAPNIANISRPWDDRVEPKNPVQVVKQLFDAKMRAMFTVPDGSYLVGTDAESIQLRILAHYLKNDDYVDAILRGDKADGTDIHNVNRRALGLDWLTRDHAKTFIYAWLLGAGVGKVARILECTHAAAKQAVANFIESTKGLGELKRGLIRSDASRGYFEGLDGRRVLCDSDYYMLAGYLQNGETLVMKHANWLWREWAIAEKISFKQVNFVHDEWQTEVNDSLDAAEKLGELQCKALTVVGERLHCYCPMAGETKIGCNWLDTH